MFIEKEILNKEGIYHPIKLEYYTIEERSDLKDERSYFITAMYIQNDQLEETALYQCNLDYFGRIKYQDWIVFPWEE